MTKTQQGDEMMVGRCSQDHVERNGDNLQQLLTTSTITHIFTHLFPNKSFKTRDFLLTPESWFLVSFTLFTRSLLPHQKIPHYYCTTVLFELHWVNISMINDDYCISTPSTPLPVFLLWAVKETISAARQQRTPSLWQHWGKKRNKQKNNPLS